MLIHINIIITSYILQVRFFVSPNINEKNEVSVRLFGLEFLFFSIFDIIFQTPGNILQ